MRQKLDKEIKLLLTEIKKEVQLTSSWLTSTNENGRRLQREYKRLYKKFTPSQKEEYNKLKCLAIDYYVESKIHEIEEFIANHGFFPRKKGTLEHEDSLACFCNSYKSRHNNKYTDKLNQLYKEYGIYRNQRTNELVIKDTYDFITENSFCPRENKDYEYMLFLSIKNHKFNEYDSKKIAIWFDVFGDYHGHMDKDKLVDALNNFCEKMGFFPSICASINDYEKSFAKKYYNYHSLKLFDEEQERKINALKQMYGSNTQTSVPERILYNTIKKVLNESKINNFILSCNESINYDNQKSINLDIKIEVPSQNTILIIMYDEYYYHKSEKHVERDNYVNKALYELYKNKTLYILRYRVGLGDLDEMPHCLTNQYIPSKKEYTLSDYQQNIDIMFNWINMLMHQDFHYELTNKDLIEIR